MVLGKVWGSIGDGPGGHLAPQDPSLCRELAFKLLQIPLLVSTFSADVYFWRDPGQSIRPSLIADGKTSG